MDRYDCMSTSGLEGKLGALVYDINLVMREMHKRTEILNVTLKPMGVNPNREEIHLYNSTNSKYHKKGVTVLTAVVRKDEEARTQLSRPTTRMSSQIYPSREIIKVEKLNKASYRYTLSCGHQMEGIYDEIVNTTGLGPKSARKYCIHCQPKSTTYGSNSTSRRNTRLTSSRCVQSATASRPLRQAQHHSPAPTTSPTNQ